MTKFKIVYWQSGELRTVEIAAATMALARYMFEMNVPNDDIVAIEEVVE